MKSHFILPTGLTFCSSILLVGCLNSGGSSAANTNSTPTPTPTPTLTPSPTPEMGPDAFSFTNQSGTYLSTPIDSDDVVLTGSFSDATATCNYACAAISVNGGPWNTGSVSGINPGVSIAIRAISASALNREVVASVTIGITTSVIWRIRTMTTDPCTGSPSPGTTCADKTIFFDNWTDGKLVTSSSAATSTTWATGETVFTGATSNSDGLANTNTLVSFNSGDDGPYDAATYCSNLVAHGHSDWYLPSINELESMWARRSLIGPFQDALYASSTEVDAGHFKAKMFNNNGFYFDWWKTYPGIKVRCVRKVPFN